MLKVLFASFLILMNNKNNFHAKFNSLSLVTDSQCDSANIFLSSGAWDSALSCLATSSEVLDSQFPTTALSPALVNLSYL